MAQAEVNVQAAEPAVAPPARAELPTAAYLRYALGLLLIVNVLNFIDRQVVSILAESIKVELQLADWQIGMMTGLAFALFYTTLGISLARFAERADRPLIISGSIVVWSGCTILCGMAQNFWQLITARIGVGVGEAGCTPAAHSLIGDYTPIEKRASALALYSMGTPLGSVFGLMLGGLAADAWGWRTAFFICGAPGLLVGLMVLLTLKEPRRRLARDLSARATARSTLRDAAKTLRGKRTYWLLAMGTAMTGVVGYGGGSFIPIFFLRNHGEELTALGAAFGMQALGFFGVTVGVSAGVAGILGTWLGGALADRYGPGNPRAYAVIPAAAALLCYPFYIAAVLVDSAVTAIALLSIANMMITVWSGPVFAGVQSLVKPHMHATASAVVMFMISTIGLCLGPLIVGGLSDFLAGPLGFGAAEGIRWAQAAVTGAGFVSIVFFWIAGRTITSEVSR